MRPLRLLTFLFALAVAALLRGAAVPPLTGRVVDAAGVLTAAERDALEQRLSTFEKSTGGQMAVLLTRRIPEGETLEGYALKVAETWSLGHKGKDNGTLLWLALDDRRSRLEIGYGWEAYINDARAGDILRRMAPLLREGHTAEAIAAAVTSVSSYVTAQVPAMPETSARRDPFSVGMMILLLGGGIWLVIRHPWILLAFLFGGRGGSWGGGGFRGGGFRGGGGGRGGFGGGGGFRGGGGGFGGGGASGGW